MINESIHQEKLIITQKTHNANKYIDSLVEQKRGLHISMIVLEKLNGHFQ